MLAGTRQVAGRERCPEGVGRQKAASGRGSGTAPPCCGSPGRPEVPALRVQSEIGGLSPVPATLHPERELCDPVRGERASLGCLHRGHGGVSSLLCLLGGKLPWSWLAEIGQVAGFCWFLFFIIYYYYFKFFLRRQQARTRSWTLAQQERGKSPGKGIEYFRLMSPSVELSQVTPKGGSRSAGSAPSGRGCAPPTAGRAASPSAGVPRVFWGGPWGFPRGERSSGLSQLPGAHGGGQLFV